MTDDTRDPKTGQFLRGNAGGRGRPYRSPGLVKSYGEAIAQSCPPEKLAAIVRKAVKVALGDGPDAHGARMFLLKAIGADQINVFLNTRPDRAGAVYHLNSLSDEELEVLGRLSAKMIEAPTE